ncbi:MFS transporter [Bacillus sp. AFS026049]|uniref:MFS transporter n=1 Tax=Peribacillus frigoritolerans TaxID=450367 RepID=UPI000BED8437|nr:MFS transporter [Peribacillus frigoritolerans]MBD8137818.1 MFS transporter [Bacillus sp. CFBP 13597]MCR8871741.1 MFS transporter [Peribacillus frigoritolerans]PEF38437.1 MFS transporter [Bacillus sp. AFS094228]PEO44122.1 MFS transporter [Bacillus sp. AFS026049]
MNKQNNNLLILILTIGVFGILTTEMGVIGILPAIAEQFDISVSRAGLLVSLFALVVAISGPIMPLLFSGINRRTVMLLVLGIFILGNIVSMFASNFTVLLIARVIPAFFHPIYCSLALTVAATSVSREEAPKAVSKVIMGVSAGMILGVPITNFIANQTSIQMSILFFAIVNIIAFLATLIFVPSLPVNERLSYGAQISVLKKPIVWLAIATVIFLNSGTSSINTFITEYLETITNISGNTLTFALFLLGVASLIGALLGGRMLSRNAVKTAITFPIVLGIVHLLSFITGKSIGPMMITILLWGILFAISNSVSQYWITNAAPEAPDFANGLFLSCGNIGVTIGTGIGGLIISGMGTQYIVLGGLLFLLLGLASIVLSRYMFSDRTERAAI